MATRRWIRLDAAWEDSPWLDELDGTAAGCWPRILCHVKRDGVRGRAKRIPTAVAARKWRVPVAAVEALENAAVADGALRIDDGDWVIHNWDTYQQTDTRRKHRQRKQRHKGPRRTPPDPTGSPGDPTGPQRTPSLAVARDIDRDRDRDRIPDEASSSSLESKSRKPVAGGTRETPPTDAGRDAAQSEMRTALEAARCPEQLRAQLDATAEGIIAGDSYTNWQDPTGTQVPWAERPRIFRLALQECQAEGQWRGKNLRGALRLHVAREMDPHQLPRSNGPAAGSEAAGIREELPGRERRVGGELRRVSIYAGGPLPPEAPDA